MNMLSPIKIGVGGTSKIKIGAVQECISEMNIHATVSGVPGSDSNSDEQPAGKSAGLYGAVARVVTGVYSDPSFDLYFGIENAINKTQGKWEDFATIAAATDENSERQIELTDGVEFPEEQVLKTLNMPGGFKENTVGSVLYADGIVTSSKDPHFSLCGIHRKDILKPAIKKILQHYLDTGVLHLCPETDYQGV